ncbi:hypothetical protein JQN72_00455 [Phycicoccus sp. CSK15P-2]|uniref:hypothetical protein n=1 Tax=Phycicoccus sp. CSK15P-2 TaxID=2807627 RepID=UPI00195289F3|nr:hypothetical protein [Phycicoccus sp. CSK15P-2]MBM6402715.1 hypothetical protein [Phycicoccus sp. CSK15P-2]
MSAVPLGVETVGAGAGSSATGAGAGVAAAGAEGLDDVVGAVVARPGSGVGDGSDFAAGEDECPGVASGPKAAGTAAWDGTDPEGGVPAGVAGVEAVAVTASGASSGLLATVRG